jgi:hypothetical protein
MTLSKMIATTMLVPQLAHGDVATALPNSPICTARPAR